MRPLVAVLLASLCFGTTGTAQALAEVDASPLSVGAARIALGGGLLALVAWASSRSGGRPDADAPGTPALTARRRILAIAVGSLGVLAYQPAFFAGTRMNGVAIGTVVALGSAPVVTGILAAVRDRRLPSGRWTVATAVALVGVALVGGVAGAGDVSAWGLAASVGAGASYALYTLASKELLAAGWTAPRVMGTVFGWAAAVSVPLVVLTGAAWIGTARGVALVAWLGVVTTAAAYLLFGSGLRQLAAPTVATLTLAEPLTATVLGLVVLGESLGASSVVGLLILSAGLLLLAKPGPPRAPQHT